MQQFGQAALRISSEGRFVPRVHGGTDVKCSALAEIGATTRSVSVSRQRLLDRGLIDANKHGRLSFTVPGFSEFVIDQAENE